MYTIIDIDAITSWLAFIDIDATLDAGLPLNID